MPARTASASFLTAAYSHCIAQSQRWSTASLTEDVSGGVAIEGLLGGSWRLDAIFVWRGALPATKAFFKKSVLKKIDYLACEGQGGMRMADQRARILECEIWARARLIMNR